METIKECAIIKRISLSSVHRKCAVASGRDTLGNPSLMWLMSASVDLIWFVKSKLTVLQQIVFLFPVSDHGFPVFQMPLAPKTQKYFHSKIARKFHKSLLQVKCCFKFQILKLLEILFLIFCFCLHSYQVCLECCHFVLNLPDINKTVNVSRNLKN